VRLSSLVLVFMPCTDACPIPRSAAGADAGACSAGAGGAGGAVCGVFRAAEESATLLKAASVALNTANTGEAQVLAIQSTVEHFLQIL